MRALRDRISIPLLIIFLLFFLSDEQTYSLFLCNMKGFLNVSKIKKKHIRNYVVKDIVRKQEYHQCSLK